MSRLLKSTKAICSLFILTLFISCNPDHYVNLSMSGRLSKESFVEINSIIQKLEQDYKEEVKEYEDKLALANYFNETPPDKVEKDFQTQVCLSLKNISNLPINYPALRCFSIDLQKIEQEDLSFTINQKVGIFLSSIKSRLHSVKILLIVKESVSRTKLKEGIYTKDNTRSRSVCTQKISVITRDDLVEEIEANILTPDYHFIFDEILL